MTTIRFLQLGWVIAAAFIGIAFAGGFQESAAKFGVVDITKVIESSDYGKANQDTFAKMKQARQSLLEFLDTYRVLTTEQAQRIRELTLKPNPTPEEQAELDRSKADVIAASKRSTELSTMPNLTPEERTLMEDYARRSQSMHDLAQRWYQEFTTEMQTWADKQKLDSITRARAAVQEVAKAQGFTVVFEVGVAPYGSNDLTDTALQAMNAKK
jgi:Skp family chaperone for outer membrane proteins